MNNPSRCPVCRGECEKQEGVLDSAFWFTCKTCGHYGVNRRPLLKLEKAEQNEFSSNLRALLSHQLRTQQNQDGSPVITTAWLNSLNDKLPS